MKRLSSIDANFLYIETDAVPMHYLLAGLVEGELTRPEIEETILAKLPEVPLFTEKVVTDRFRLRRPSWETDPFFNLDRHLFEVELTGTEDELLALATKIFAGVMDRDKPLWELHLVHGLSGNRSAVILKLHHCFGEAAADLKTIMSALPMPRPELTTRGPSDVTSLGERNLACCVYSAAEARAIASARDASISDVMLAVLTGGIRRYFKRHQHPVADLRVLLAAGGEIEIPLELKDPLECLQHVTTSSKRGTAAKRVESRNRSPSLANILWTNVPAPQSPLHLFDRPAVAIYPFATVPHGFGLSCALVEHDEKVDLLLTIDAHAVADAQHLRECLDHSFTRLLDVAGLTKQETFDERLQQAAETDQYEVLSEYVREQVAIVLNWEEDQPPDPRQGFFDLGMDSLATMKLAERLQTGFATQLPATLVFETPNIEALTNYLATEVLGWNDQTSDAIETVPRSVETPHQLLEKIQFLSDEEVERLLASR